jgi:hypothetical protein
VRLSLAANSFSWVSLETLSASAKAPYGGEIWLCSGESGVMWSCTQESDACKQTCTTLLNLDILTQSCTILFEPTQLAACLWMETDGMPLREAPYGAAKENNVVWKN